MALILVFVCAMLAGCGQPLAAARTAVTTRTPRPAATRIPGALPPAATATAAPTATTVAAPIATAGAPAGAAATAGPSATPARSVSPIVPATLAPIAYNDRWRQQQVDRAPLAAAQQYTTAGTELYWYDPVFQQSVLLGTFRGNFDVLATFTLRSSGQPALEVLYEVNKRYGLTALSPAIVERIEAAGYTEFIDTYVLLDERVAPR